MAPIVSLVCLLGKEEWNQGRCKGQRLREDAMASGPRGVEAMTPPPSLLPLLPSSTVPIAPPTPTTGTLPDDQALRNHSHRPPSSPTLVSIIRTPAPYLSSMSSRLPSIPFPDDVPTHPLLVVSYPLLLAHLSHPTQETTAESAKLFDACTSLG